MQLRNAWRMIFHETESRWCTLMSFFRKHQGAHTWLPELEQRFIALEGKPHWGKMYYEKPEKTPASEAFEAIRKKLDPGGVFAFEQAPYTPDAEAFQDPRDV